MFCFNITHDRRGRLTRTEEEILKQGLQAQNIHFFTFIQNETKEVIFLSNTHLQSFKSRFNNLSDNVIVDLNYLSMKKMDLNVMYFSVD